jgi:DNA mismatch endonuclease (patch repair protein)
MQPVLYPKDNEWEMMDRSENMRRIKGRNTRPEMLVRRLVHGMGFRYRLHVGDLPGKPDLVFVSKKKIIFVHGCFWHQHEGCRNAQLPKTNQEYWLPKLKATRARDLRNMNVLSGLGWKILLLWECKLKDKELLKRILQRFLVQ